MQSSKCKTGGFGLVEIIVASAIIASALVGLSATAVLASRSLTETAHRAQARILAEEAMEAVRVLRDTSWSDNIAGIPDEAVRYPAFSTTTNSWSLDESSPGLIDGVFERTVRFDAVRRDEETDDIAPDGGAGTYEDDGTRRITARVVWDDKDVELQTYITDIFE